MRAAKVTVSKLDESVCGRASPRVIPKFTVIVRTSRYNDYVADEGRLRCRQQNDRKKRLLDGWFDDAGADDDS